MEFSFQNLKFLRPPATVAIHAASFGVPFGIVLPRLGVSTMAVIVGIVGWLCVLMAEDRSPQKFHPAAWWWVYLGAVAVGRLALAIGVSTGPFCGTILNSLGAMGILCNLCRLFVGLSTNKRVGKE